MGKGRTLKLISRILVGSVPLFLVVGCSAKTAVPGHVFSRALGRASQAMAQGAEVGAQLAGSKAYVEREPHPNAYVGGLLYERYCDACHGVGKAPDILTKRVTEPEAESDYYAILYGLVEMPGFRSKLTQFQILDILSYMNVDLSNFKPENHHANRVRRGDGSTQKKKQEDILK